jgi:hypothetical protein
MFNTVSKLQYNNETVSNTGSMAHAGQSAKGASNPGVAGYIVGGVGLSGGDRTTNVQKVSFITGTVSVPANLPNDGYLFGRSAVSNHGTAAYFSGGDAQNNASVTNVSYIFPYSTETSSTSNALPTGLAYAGSWDNGSTAGYVYLGRVPGEKFPGSTTQMRKITYSNSTWSTPSYTFPTDAIHPRGYSNNGDAGYWQNGGSMLKFVYSTETASYSATGASLAVNSGSIMNEPMSYHGVAGYGPGSSSTAIYKFLFSTNTQSTLSATYTNRRSSMGSVSNF